MARYHSLPESLSTHPNFFSFGSSMRTAELVLESHRADLAQHWDLVDGQVVHNRRNPSPPARVFYSARQYCRLFDITAGDPSYAPVTSWSVRPELRIGVADKDVNWEPFVFPKSPCKPPVVMIRTTHLTDIREAMLHDKMDTARRNGMMPFDADDGIVPVVKDFRIINRMEGTVALLERPSLNLMQQIFKDLLRKDDDKIERTADGRIMSMGSAPQFFTEQSIFLGLPTFKQFQDLILGLRDSSGAPLHTFSSYRDCLAWPFIGIVSAEAAEAYSTFRAYINADKMMHAMFEVW